MPVIPLEILLLENGEGLGNALGMKEQEATVQWYKHEVCNILAHVAGIVCLFSYRGQARPNSSFFR